jgi:hypothetical protein
VEVGDSDLAGSGQTQVTFRASSSTQTITITLNESSHPGLFRGSVVLVATNAQPNQLAVRNGDTLTVTYFDASNNSNVVAAATIDTVAPAISQVQANVDITTAQVAWNTSEPADSLVQYGESVLLDRTAYSAELLTNHSVAINGLSANRIYYYQVVSRDQAGNTAEDDNQGALYTFQTRPARRPPWLDDLETGAPGWTVVPDSSGSDINWTLGTPNNGLETAAHSGTNAWGSNLEGQNFNIASSFLYSPVIDLSGFSKITLTFWDSFDFSSGLEDGQLGISTNSSTPPATIPTLVDFAGQTTSGWEQESVDLTPFVGQTVQLVWYYQGVPIGSTLHGWLIDDIEVTGTASSQGGTIMISANLGQESFKLSGPVSVNGTGLSTSLTNAPLGDYTISFGDVDFYETPTNQSGSLTKVGGTLSFTGNYTFIDANHNGISDAWEKYYFAAVTTNRSQLTDTDGDGMTDYQEFIAGTDPTNPASKLIFVSTIQTNSTVQFKWSAVPGRSYQVLGSSDLVSWTPVGDWMRATVSPMSFVATNAAPGSRSYKVQVRP